MKWLWILLLSAGLAGCGGDSDANPDDENGGSGGSSGAASGGGGAASGSGGNAACTPPMGPIDPSALIDDFEDGNSKVPMIDGRQSDWWLTTDETPAGSVTPLPGALLPERILGGRCDSLYALRISGQGYTTWGAVISAALRYEDGKGEVGVDLSAFRGMRFWARAGELNTANVRIGFQDASTHPRGGVCDAESMEVGVQCYDSFGIELPLASEWREYAVYFERLQQRGFGLPVEKLDSTQLYEINFTVPENTIFDFWIDDVWLFE